MREDNSNDPSVCQFKDALPTILQGAHWPSLGVDGLLRIAGRAADAADPVTGVAFALCLGNTDGRLAMAVSYLGEWHKPPTRHALDYRGLEDYLGCRVEALQTGERELTALAFNSDGFFWCLDASPANKRCVELIQATRPDFIYTTHAMGLLDEGGS